MRVNSFISQNVTLATEQRIKILSRSEIHLTLFSCKEFDESGDSGEFDDCGEFGVRQGSPVVHIC